MFFSQFMQDEREAKRIELQKVQDEVRAWRQAEVAKREARRTASNTLLVSLYTILSIF